MFAEDRKNAETGSEQPSSQLMGLIGLLRPPEEFGSSSKTEGRRWENETTSQSLKGETFHRSAKTPPDTPLHHHPPYLSILLRWPAKPRRSQSGCWIPKLSHLKMGRFWLPPQNEMRLNRTIYTV